MLSVYLLGVFIGALDTSVLGPAFPLIARGFSVSLAWTAWTVTVYTVAYAATTILAGSAGDRLGRRRIFGLGIAAFGVASLLAALAPSFIVFLLARVIQGAGAGAVYPNAQAEGIRQFPPERRGLALGMFGAVFGVAAIIGPAAGGALAQYLGWPAVFWVNIPLAIVVLILVPRLPRAAGTARALPDWSGGLCFAGALAAALLGLEAGGWGAASLFAAAVVLAGLFVWRQRRARLPFLDTRPLVRVSGVALVCGAALIGLSMSAAVFIPTLAQEVLGFSVLGSGLSLLPAALSGAVLAGIAGVLVDRRGPRGVLQVGLIAGVVGGVLLAWPQLTFLIFFVAMLAFGVATACTMGAPLNRMALALYRDDQAGEALSLIAVCRSVGMAAGPVALTLLQARFGFAGMFGGVAVASALGIGLFAGVPDVRPAPRGQAARTELASGEA